MKTRKTEIKLSFENQNRENEKGENRMLLTVNNFAYQSYRQFVKGNYDASLEDVAKKLTRNVILGFPLPVENTDHIWYAYGKLRILVKNQSEVVCILNNQPLIAGWYANDGAKEALNRFLEIS